MANRIMETYVPFIPSNKEFCTRSGKIPGDDVVPTGHDICWAYKFVDELPDLSKVPQKICIPSDKIGQFQPGEVLIAKETEDSIGWDRLPVPEKGIGVPTDFTCVYSADRTEVSLRWKDPVDTGPYVWKKTRVLRKFGGYPANENDGVIVAESTRRDQYFDNELVDQLPTCFSQSRWHYKIFVYSIDGVVTSDGTCQLEPAEPEWGSTMHTQIQNGRAKNIFHIGDEITVFNGSRSYTFVVNGFDMAMSADEERKRTVMLVSKTPLVSGLQFDKPHPEYVPYVGTAAVKGTVVYYQKVGSSYKIVSIPTGAIISAEANIYVKEKDINAIQYGLNMWSTSSSRSYLNGSWLNALINTDSDFGSMITSVYSETLDGTIDKVRLPTLEQMNDSVVAMSGWSCIPVEDTTYSLYYRSTHGVDSTAYAKAEKNSHIIIHIG